MRNTYAIEFLDFKGSSKTIVPDTIVIQLREGPVSFLNSQLLIQLLLPSPMMMGEYFFNKRWTTPGKENESIQNVTSCT